MTLEKSKKKFFLFLKKKLFTVKVPNSDLFCSAQALKAIINRQTAHNFCFKAVAVMLNNMLFKKIYLGPPTNRRVLGFLAALARWLIEFAVTLITS